MNQIHPTAIIHDNVEIGDNNIIGAYSVIGDNVVIGSNNNIGNHCDIGGPFWRNNKANYCGKVIIGDNNMIVHGVTILSPYEKKETRIGNFNQIFSHSLIGHDVRIQNHVFMAAGSKILGVCNIKNFVTLGADCCIRERITIFRSAIIGMGSAVIRNVSPYNIVAGVPARSLGYKKRAEIIKRSLKRKLSKLIKKIYKIILTFLRGVLK